LIAACAHRRRVPSYANAAARLGGGNPSGIGLDRHDALYCGEWQLTNPGETIYLVKGGKVVWTHVIDDKDELGDCTMASNGHVFLRAQELRRAGDRARSGERPGRQDRLGVQEGPGETEVHSVQPIGTDKAIVMQNGNPPKLLLIDKTKAPSCTSDQPCVAKTWNPEAHGSVHGMFRHVRMLANGNLLVPYTGGKQAKVVEYDADWKVVWQYDEAPSPWAAVRLPNGNTLISGNHNKYVREVTPDKKVVWELTQKDIPDITFYTLQEAMRLPNGNTIVNNWCGGGLPKADWAEKCVQVFEVTPEKKVVWKVQQWKDPNLGPGSATQLLDQPGVPEKPGQQLR
jgi:hypothetical protein